MAYTPFSRQKLLECLTDREGFHNRFRQYRERILEVDMSYIRGIIEAARDILSGTLATPIRRIVTLRVPVGSLQMLKAGFETYQYSFLVLLEVELLPILKSIAQYRRNEMDDDRGDSYFVETLRLPATKENETMGASFLRLVLECISAWARVKRYYCLEDCELEETPSKFAQTFKQLEQEGVCFPSTYTYFKESEFDSMRHQFYQKLNRISDNRQRYVGCYENILKAGLAGEQHYRGHDMQQLIRLCRFGDSYIVGAALKFIEDVFNMSKQPLQRLLALKLTNELVKAGEFEAIEFCRKLTEVLLEQIESAGGNDLTLKRGTRLYPGEEGAKYGLIYYGEALKSILLWAKALPGDPFRIKRKDYESEFVKTYRRLASKKYEFPHISEQEVSGFRNEYSRMRCRMQQSLEEKEIKNEAMMQILAEGDGESRMRSSQASLPVEASMRRVALNRNQIPSIVKQPIEDRLETARMVLTQFRNISGESDENRKWVASAVNYLRQFSDSFEELVVQSDRFDSLYREGIEVMERSEEIARIHAQWKQSGLPFEILVEKVQNRLEGFADFKRIPSGSRASVLRSSAKKAPEQQSLFRSKGQPREQAQQHIRQEEFKQAKSIMKESPPISIIANSMEAQANQPIALVGEYFNVRSVPTQMLPTREATPILTNSDSPVPAQQKSFAKNKEQSKPPAGEPQSFQSARSKFSSSSDSIHEKLREELSPGRKSAFGRDHQQQLANHQAVATEPLVRNSATTPQLEELQKVKSELRRQQISRLRQINEESRRHSGQQSFQSFKSNQSAALKAQLKAQCEAVMLVAGAMSAEQPQPAANELRLNSNKSAESKQFSKFSSHVPSVMRDYGIGPGVAAGQSLADRANGFCRQQDPNLQSHLRKRKLEVVSCSRARSSRNEKLVPDGQRDNLLDSKVSLMRVSNGQVCSSESSLRAGSLTARVQHAEQLRFPNGLAQRNPLPDEYVCIQQSRLVAMSRCSGKQSPLQDFPKRQPVPLEPQSNSLIQEPSLQPQQHSYHQLVEPNLLVLQGNPTFKAALQVEPIIPNAKNTDRYWMEQNLQTLSKVANSETPKALKRAQEYQILPEVMAEHSEEHSKEMKLLSSLYSRKYEELQQCVKKLERDVQFRDRLVSEKQEEINSLKGTMTQKDFGSALRGQREPPTENSNCLVIPKMSSSQPPPLIRNEYWAEPPGKHFGWAAYMQSLHNIQDHRSKRSMLKNKDILYKNGQLEIGVIVSRESEVKVALYFQSEADFNELSVRLEGASPWMKLQVEPQFPTRLPAKKQEKVVVGFRMPDIKDLLYEVPSLVVRYRPSYSTVDQLVSIPFPITFNRCVQFREPLSQEQLEHHLKPLVLCTPDFQYSSKILKDPRDVEIYFPKALLLPSQNGFKYGLMLSYKSINGAVLICISENGCMQIKGNARGASPGEASRVIESLLSTLMWLFCREHNVSKLGS